MTFVVAIFATILAAAAAYQCFFALIGHLYRSRQLQTNLPERRFAVMLPAYREDAVILRSAQAALGQNYGNFEVVVIADSLKPSTLTALRAMPLRIVEVQFEQSTKARALKAAMAQLPDYDAVAILDADNIMAPDFLARMNAMLAKGYKAVQGTRAAMKTNTSMALLDGVSEDVNTHILCKGHAVLGLSARLAGSGMAFEYGLFREVMTEVDAIGGFDKELELRYTALGECVGFDAEAIVFDEKVSKADNFARQRGRWLAAQYTYAARFAGSAFRKLIGSGNFDHFNKFSQMLLPPRVLVPVVLAFGALVSPWASEIWMFGAVCSFISFAVAIPTRLWLNRQLWAGFCYLPVAVLATLRALTWMPAARKRFLHTAHG